MNNEQHLGKGSICPKLPDDGELRLYSMRFCPFAQRVHLVLNAKNLPYHVIFIDLNNKPEWLIEKSPLLKVPALECPTEPNNPTLIESLIIADYLDEKYSDVPLYSTDPLRKAEDRILIERFNPVIGSLYKLFTEIELQPHYITEVKNGLDVFENELKKRGTPFFGGAKPMMVDYMIWPWCERSDMLKYLLDNNVYVLDEDRFGKLLKWKESMIKIDAVKKYFLDGETHAKFMKTRRAGNPDYDLLNNMAKKQKLV